MRQKTDLITHKYNGSPRTHNTEVIKKPERPLSFHRPPTVLCTPTSPHASTWDPTGTMEESAQDPRANSHADNSLAPEPAVLTGRRHTRHSAKRGPGSSTTRTHTLGVCGLGTHVMQAIIIQRGGPTRLRKPQSPHSADSALPGWSAQRGNIMDFHQLAGVSLHSLQLAFLV